MILKKLARTGFPVLFALLVIAGLIVQSHLSDVRTPSIQNGVLDFAGWNGEKEIELVGDWEFYWDVLLDAGQINSGDYTPVLVTAPNKWNSYQLDDKTLPSRGKATYRLHVTGAQAGVQYGIRVPRISTDYMLYIDDALVAKNDGLDGSHDIAYDYRSRLGRV